MRNLFWARIGGGGRGEIRNGRKFFKKVLC